MPVRFRCHGCHRVLSALDRKIGEEVNCPGCGALLVVPTADLVPAPPAVSRPPERFRRSHLDPATEIRPDFGGVCVSRRVLYAQAVLLAVAAAGFFVAGYFIGRSDNSGPIPNGVEPRTIEVAGRITIAASGTEPRPDAGAAVLILPAQRQPRRDAKLDIVGLNPLAPLPAIDDPVLSGIAALGGSYARTDDAGHFRVALPESGRYHVLAVSRELSRGAAEPGRIDLATLGEYVADALALLGNRRHVLVSRELRDGQRVDHEFRE